MIFGKKKSQPVTGDRAGKFLRAVRASGRDEALTFHGKGDSGDLRGIYLARYDAAQDMGVRRGLARVGRNGDNRAEGPGPWPRWMSGLAKQVGQLRLDVDMVAFLAFRNDPVCALQEVGDLGDGRLEVRLAEWGG